MREDCRLQFPTPLPLPQGTPCNTPPGGVFLRENRWRSARFVDRRNGWLVATSKVIACESSLRFLAKHRHADAAAETSLTANGPSDRRRRKLPHSPTDARRLRNGRGARECEQAAAGLWALALRAPRYEKFALALAAICLQSATQNPAMCSACATRDARHLLPARFA